MTEEVDSLFETAVNIKNETIEWESTGIEYIIFSWYNPDEGLQYYYFEPLDLNLTYILKSDPSSNNTLIFEVEESVKATLSKEDLQIAGCSYA